MFRRVAVLLAVVACSPEPTRSVTLTPATPALAAILNAADARWEAAGVDRDRIRIESGGAPVLLVPERAPVSETRIIKRGLAFAGVRWMDLASLDVDNATHEMGHALGIEWATEHSVHLDGPECERPHHERPLMCAVGGGSLTAADLDLACSVGECEHFTPEAP